MSRIFDDGCNLHGGFHAKRRSGSDGHAASQFAKCRIPPHRNGISDLRSSILDCASLLLLLG